MRKAKKKIWLFILIPILVVAVVGSGAYFYLQTKLKSGGDPSKTKIVNAMIKEGIKHPIEMKKMMDSATVVDGDASTSSDDKKTSANTVHKNADKSTVKSSSSVKKTEPAQSSSSHKASSKNETDYDNSSVSSIEYMKSHRSEYELLSTGAKNLGGDTYRLTATVRHKPTGKINTIEVTTQLSQDMKETLKSYAK